MCTTCISKLINSKYWPFFSITQVWRWSLTFYMCHYTLQTVIKTGYDWKRERTNVVIRKFIWQHGYWKRFKKGHSSNYMVRSDIKITNTIYAKIKSLEGMCTENTLNSSLSMPYLKVGKGACVSFSISTNDLNYHVQFRTVSFSTYKKAKAQTLCVIE